MTIHSFFRRTGIRTRLVASFAGMTILLTLILVEAVGVLASRQLKNDIGKNLSELAFQTVDKLDRSMYERYREVQLMAARPELADARIPAERKRAMLETMQSTYPYYAWLGIADNQGKVLVSAKKMLEGADVSQRPWFVNAYKNIYLNDVHDAVLLAKLLPNPTNEPKRFFDVAFPYRAENGETAGVFGIHLSWQWASEVEKSVLRPVADRSKVEALIVARDSTVLLGPPELLGQKLELPSLAEARRQTGFLSEQWRDGKQYLVGFSQSHGYASYPGFGWTVLVRQNLEDAYLPVAQLQRQIFIGGLLIAALFSLFGLFLSKRMAAPLRLIAESAGKIEAGEGKAISEIAHGYREVDVMTRALNSLLGKLNANEASLKELNLSLERRVAERTAELERAHDAMQASEERIRAIVDTALDAFVGMDAQGRVTDWNSQAEAIFGWRKDEVMGKLVADVIMPQRYRQAHTAGLERMLSGAESAVLGQRLQLHAIRRSGEEFPVEMAISRVLTGSGHFYSAFINDISERKRIEDELAKERELLSAVLETIDVAVVACDGRAQLTLFNRAATAFHGLSLLDIPPQEWSAHYRLFHADGATDMRMDEIPLVRALNGEIVTDSEMVVRPHHGPARSLLASGRTLYDAAHNKLGAVVVMKDITERKATEQALAESRERLATITDNMPILISYVGKDGRYQFTNHTYEAWFGRPRHAIYGRTARELLGEEQYTVVAPHIEKVLSGERCVFEHQLRIGDKLRHAEATYIPHWSAHGDVLGYYVMVLDITERKNHELRIEQLASHDALTGLPNRRACLAKLQEAIDRAARSKKALAVLFLDLNKFKQINDTYGHEIGDKVLAAFAELLKTTVRKTDVVARLAGDEFVIIAEGLMNAGEDALLIGQKIVAALEAPLLTGEPRIVASTSIGIALHAGGEAGSPASLLKRADEGMYTAKRQGKNICRPAD